MGKLILSLMAIGFTSSVFAQSSVTKGTKPSSTTQPRAELPLDARPSRLVTPEDVNEYSARIASKFLIKSQGRDPFGNNQDLTVAPIAKTTTNEVVVQPNRITLAEIVKRLSITMIRHGEKQIIIGTRSFTLGDEIPVTISGKPLALKFTAITAQQLTFKNVATGETAIRELNPRPAGMTPGKKRDTPVGMTPTNSNAPIDLGGNDPAP
jgi:hypothetical protein